MIVLDTNILSELMRPAPNPLVVDWVDAMSVREAMATTAITVAEILYGIDRLPSGRRRQRLGDVAATMFEEDFAGLILAFDADAALPYAERAASSEAAGHRAAMPDAHIAAICLSHEATLATRNTKDFESFGVTLVNPWNQR